MVTPTATDRERELVKWAASPLYFLATCGRIYDPMARDWIPFHPWPEQVQVLDTIHAELLTVILKARQLGLSWLVLGYALWSMIFRPEATVLLFSRREEEATYLLGDERLRGMHKRLPDWLLATMRAHALDRDAAKTWALANGSTCRAFPTSAGDSYTATLAVVDEADLVPDLGRLLRSVKPTIDAGGKLILLSRADKSKPGSEFKKVYQGAKEGKTPWRAIFLPWYVHPGRDEAWYERQRADVFNRTGSLDDLHEQYPATDAEALSPRTLDKRIAPAWLHQCYRQQLPLPALPADAPSIPGLEVYALPQRGRLYALGADPAEGNPTSNDSALTVLDVKTGEEVAALAGKFQPSTLAAHADAIARWYNGAPLMVERNNHGHAVLLWLEANSPLVRLCGHDGKVGWMSSEKGKTLLYDGCADAFRNEETVLHSFASFTQLASIEGSTLRAPEGELDDRADSYALALVAARVVPGLLADDAGPVEVEVWGTT